MIDALAVFAPAPTTISATGVFGTQFPPAGTPTQALQGTPLNALWARLDISAIANCNATFWMQGAPETFAGSGVAGTFKDLAPFSQAGSELVFAPGEFFCGFITDPQIAFLQVYARVPGNEDSSAASSGGAASITGSAALCTGRNG